MKNQLIKFAASFVIVCSFILSANAQSATTNQVAQMTPEQRIEMRVNKLTTSLNLTPDQASKVKDLFTAEYNARHTKNKEAMKSHTAMKEEMAKILTPEQMTKFNQMAEQQKEKHMEESPKGK